MLALDPMPRVRVLVVLHTTLVWVSQSYQHTVLVNATLILQNGSVHLFFKLKDFMII